MKRALVFSSIGIWLCLQAFAEGISDPLFPSHSTFYLVEKGYPILEVTSLPTEAQREQLKAARQSAFAADPQLEN